MNNFGTIFRQLRINQGLTLPRAAKKARLSKGVVSKFENGGNSTLNTVVKLYKTVGYTLVPRPGISTMARGGLTT